MTPDTNAVPQNASRSFQLVRRGHFDLFLAPLRPDGRHGARTHVTRVEAGSLLFGFGGGGGVPGWVTLVDGAPDSERETVDIAALPGAAGLVDAWIVSLCGAAARGPEPQDYLAARARETLQFTREPLAVSGPDGVVWMTQTQGAALWLGDTEAVIPEDIPFPLARPAWIQQQAGNAATVSSTESLLGSVGIGAGIDLFHARVLQMIVRAAQEAEARETERMRARKEADAARFDRAVRALAGPLSLAPAQAAEDLDTVPLVAACRAVGSRQGIDFTVPPEMARGERLADPVRALCRASGVRSRRVLLEGDWYRREGLPMLAWRSEGEAPLALLPRDKGGYALYDPADGTSTPLDEGIASSLQGFAVAFYRPFHHGKVTLRYLFTFGLVGAWKDVLVMAALAIAVGLLGMVMPVVMGSVFDTVIPAAQRSVMVETAVFLLAVSLASVLLGVSRDFALLRIESRMEYVVQAAIFDRLLSLPARFFRDYAAGELAQRAAAVGAIRKVLTSSAMTAVFSGIFSAFNLALLFWYSAKLAALAIGLTVLAMAALGIASFFYVRVQRQLVERQAVTVGLMLQLFAGIAKLRVSGTEKRGFAAWARAQAGIWGLTIRAERIENWLSVFNSAFPILSLAAVYYVTGMSLSGGGSSNLSTGEFIAFGSAFGAFTAAMMQLTQVALSLLVIIPMYQSVKPILQAAPEVDPSKPLAGELEGRIELSRVSFRYSEGGPPVLKDVSLHAAAGEFVAIVGPSGAGKSTVLRILLGFEKPESGAVLFDGRDIGTLDVVSVRQQIGVVLQNSTLFRGDVFENIVCSAPYTLDQAWEAAKMAGFDNDLRAMPMGMHTIVGDGGAGLSGGQRQRLMIARAIVGKPRILLFDEATSALDNHTQSVVNKSLEGMRSTRVVIAHRLSTVMKADRIYVIDGGQVAQAGTYDELMAQPGPFAALARRQLV